MGSRAAARQHKSAGQPREGRSESGKGTRAGISRFECIEEAEPVAVWLMKPAAIHRSRSRLPGSNPSVIVEERSLTAQCRVAAVEYLAGQAGGTFSSDLSWGKNRECAP